MKQIQIDRKFFAYLHLRPWIFLAFRIADPRTAPRDPYFCFGGLKIIRFSLVTVLYILLYNVVVLVL